MQKNKYMQRKRKFSITCVIVLFAGLSLHAQQFPLVIEAEWGTAGSEIQTLEMNGVTAISPASALINALNPGSAERVVTYELTFPASGHYDLYARINVGAQTFDDDSYFYGNGFGIKDPLSDADWIRVNGLAAGGYTATDAIVDGKGDAGSQVWKWINISEYAADAPPLVFYVAPDSLTQQFQIGAREDGLLIDKLVFAQAELFFTVDQLDKGEAGVEDPYAVPKVRPIAMNSDKFLGSAWNYNQSQDFADLWNQSTPENAGKWGSVERTRDQMNWTTLDSTYHVAKRYGMLFKQHTMLWGAQQPGWIGALDSAQQREEIEEWYAALANRYPDIDMIEVVNEPLHNAPNGMVPWGTNQPNVDYSGALGGAGESGWEWLLEGFRLARQYFPNSKLILNEYSVINSSNETQKYLKLINLLKEENLIDGIGEQAHAFTTKNTSATVLRNNLNALAATGLPIYLTEVDIDGPTDREQLKEMMRVFPIFWNHTGVAGVTFWGFRHGLWRTEQGAYLITPDGRERPALTWLKAFVNDTLQNVESINITAQSGELAIDEKDGTLDLNAELLPANATIKNITWSIAPAGIATIDQNGLVTALADGTATITVASWDAVGVKGTAELVVSNQTVGIKEIGTMGELAVFPNPASDHFTIQSEHEFTSVALFNTAGQEVFQRSVAVPVSSATFDVDLNKGVYLVVIRNGQNQALSRLVIR